MHIGILIAELPSDGIGGAQVQAMQLAMHLARVHRVTVFTRSRYLPPELSELSTCELSMRRCSALPGLRFVADLLHSLSLIARQRTLDVLIAYQTVIDGLIGVVAKRLVGIPVLVSVRSEKEYKLERSLKTRLLTPFVFRNADGLAVQSPTLAAELLEELERAGGGTLREEVEAKLAIIPNGIAPYGNSPVRGDAILYVGRLVEVKGVDFLIDAMRKCPDEQLVIVGDGPEMNRLRRSAAALRNVTFAGPVPHGEVAAYLSRAKILVLPSLRDEGLPNVIMEAMARGVPVIASRNAGIPDLVQHAETGFLTEPGDSEAIAAFVRQIAADRDLHSRLARNAMKEIRRYDWPQVLKKVEAALDKIVLPRPPSGS